MLWCRLKLKDVDNVHTTTRGKLIQVFIDHLQQSLTDECVRDVADIYLLPLTSVLLAGLIVSCVLGEPLWSGNDATPITGKAQQRINSALVHAPPTPLPLDTRLRHLRVARISPL